MGSLSDLQALLPRGRAWTRAATAHLTGYLEAIAQEYDRVRQRAADVVRESVPSTAVELLSEWETITGAVRCLVGASLAARQAAVQVRFRPEAPTEALTISTVQAMGYGTPDVRYWRPFQAGRSVVGDALTDDEWQHSIEITVPTMTPADDAAVRCVVQRLQHLHILVVWNFVPTGTLLTEDGEELLTEDGEPIAVE